MLKRTPRSFQCFALSGADDWKAQIEILERVYDRRADHAACTSFFDTPPVSPVSKSFNRNFRPSSTR
jgi:hypothetical protein